ncbi:DMT family transporter [Clostridium sporogenes]|uniref:DMT family transporter n=1 Tax=Clostridium botulinum TaxID=1491 RepID=A0A6M0T3E2_CLOBO|nr:DMT family transporter [Clostridium sporogenes]NFA62336.1 DMT family transporter [Clostridium botulinum]NFI73124.1 DMT family transporter [Clostridium sporogenes]NFL72676.1 DMT family transporter [Clostridium sporogenes]NFM23164.1 DMT family transporter [Clostridium sporogenes]NFP60536.1 DMT family transporter [Clostridium sporogenes]
MGKYIKNRKIRSVIADLSLLLVALIWGGGFVAVKDALDTITPYYMMTIRFICAALLLGLIFFKQMKKITKKHIVNGIVIGVFLFGAFATQTIGLQYTTAGKQAFLTAVYVVIIPFFAWFVDKTKPDWYSIVSTVLALIGIGLLTITKGFEININFGDFLTLICAFLFAAHIVAVGHFAKKSDPIILSVVQMIFAGILSLICALIFEPTFTGISKSAFGSLFYLVFFSTMLAFFIQNIAQRYTHPNHVGIILCLESVFGAILAVIFLNDVFTVNMVIGCAIIFIAIIISEIKLNFLKSKPAENEESKEIKVD